MTVRPNPLDHDLDLHSHEPVSFSLDSYAGSTYRDKPIFDLDGIIGQIATGRVIQANNGVITYSFLDKNHLTGLYNNKNYSLGDAAAGLSPFTDEQRAEARESIQLWDDLIPLQFRETNGMGSDIQFSNSIDPAQAYAYYPTKQGWKFQSDVFIHDPATNWTNAWFTPGGYGTTTLIHELGHAIGLSHPGSYNYDPDVTQDYDGLAEYAQDSEQYTLMSYWVGDETGNRVVQWHTQQFSSAQTPMLHDILAIQAQYGADTTTRTGDTVYGFNSNAGRDVFDFNLNPYPYLSIYDAGGSDTIDLSGFSASQFLDLHAGSFSSVGAGIPTAAVVNEARADLFELAGLPAPAPRSQAQVDATLNSFMNANAADIAADTGVTGIRASEYDNFSIAYGVTIENATGGSARDLLWGNQVANVLKGMDGDDVLNGFEGADTLYGGNGNDTFDFDHLETGDRIMDWNAGDKIDLRSIDANSNVAEAQAFAFVGAAAFSGAAGELRYADGLLQGDVNGDGTADFQVTLLGSPAIGVGDLMLA